MKALLSIAFLSVSLPACMSEPAPASNPPEETAAFAAKAPATDPAPLEDIIQAGDYNNDGPVNRPVPGAATDRDVPEDPFLERVKNRTPE